MNARPCRDAGRRRALFHETPYSRMMPPSRARSRRTMASKALGVLGAGSGTLSRAASTFGAAIDATKAALRRSTMGRGASLLAKMPFQYTMPISEKPVSATAGTSGRIPRRCSAVVAKMRSLPSRAWQHRDQRPHEHGHPSRDHVLGAGRLRAVDDRVVVQASGGDRRTRPCRPLREEGGQSRNLSRVVLPVRGASVCP